MDIFSSDVASRDASDVSTIDRDVGSKPAGVTLVAASPGDGAGRPERKYVLFEKIGEGGMGAVYEAFDQSEARQVAIKLIHWDLLPDPFIKTKFDTEANLALSVAAGHHPNIVQVYSREYTDCEFYKGPFLVMERLQGHNLHEYLQNNGPRPPEEVASYAEQICSGLQVFHRMGFTFRDLSLRNCFRTLTGTIKLIDMGLAKAVRPDSGDSWTRAGVLIHMAPEILRPERCRPKPPDFRVDVFALGTVMYCLLKREDPPPSIGEKLFFDGLASDRPPDEVSLLHIIAKATAQDPDARFKDVKELQRHLRQFLLSVRARAPEQPVIVEVPAVEVDGSTAGDSAPDAEPGPVSDQASSGSHEQRAGRRVGWKPALAATALLTFIVVLFVVNPLSTGGEVPAAQVDTKQSAPWPSPPPPDISPKAPAPEPAVREADVEPSEPKPDAPAGAREPTGDSSEDEAPEQVARLIDDGAVGNSKQPDVSQKLPPNQAVRPGKASRKTDTAPGKSSHIETGPSPPQPGGAGKRPFPSSETQSRLSPGDAGRNPFPSG